jgi:hypothetical protein
LALRKAACCIPVYDSCHLLAGAIFGVPLNLLSDRDSISEFIGYFCNLQIKSFMGRNHSSDLRRVSLETECHRGMKRVGEPECQTPHPAPRQLRSASGATLGYNGSMGARLSRIVREIGQGVVQGEPVAAAT